MGFNAEVLSVMIAGPQDVEAEKQTVRECLLRWNDAHARSRTRVLLPTSWKTHARPAYEPPQDVINEQVLEHCDLLVALFWARVGTPTPTAPSGTIEEIRLHTARGREAWIYFCVDPSPPGADADQLKAVELFKQECQPKALFWEYRKATLALDFAVHLELAMEEGLLGPVAAAWVDMDVSPQQREIERNVNRIVRNILIGTVRGEKEVVMIPGGPGFSRHEGGIGRDWWAGMDRLVERGYVAQEGTDTYRLTPKGRRDGMSAMASVDAARKSRPG